MLTANDILYTDALERKRQLQQQILKLEESLIGKKGELEDLEDTISYLESKRKYAELPESLRISLNNLDNLNKGELGNQSKIWGDKLISVMKAARKPLLMKDIVTIVMDNNLNDGLEKRDVQHKAMNAIYYLDRNGVLIKDEIGPRKTAYSLISYEDV